MRVLWVDADGNPWRDSNGWRVLEDFGLKLQRVSSVAEAQKLLPEKPFDLLLVRAEMQGAPSLLVQARRALANSGKKLVLVSSEWSKEQFRAHSRTDGAAHRYASVPMPSAGFLNLVADLFGCAVQELADFSAAPEEAAPPARETESAKPARRSRKAPAADSGDVEVLRKYLSIKEEQLEISEGEREELSRENERLQKEAHQLQLKLREFEHHQEELEKKITQMEDEKSEGERQALYAKEEQERRERVAGEKLQNLESQLRESNEKFENLRSRVRKDIRKIRENERDLEARLELMRKDSETLLQARDQRVLELQRQLDALEFDLDQVQDGRVQAQMEAERYLAKLSRVSRALQVANSMIEDDRAGDAELEALEPLLGGAASAEEPAEPSAPAAAEAPPPEEPAEEHALSPELEALASEGEPTQMIGADQLKSAGGESGSSG